MGGGGKFFHNGVKSESLNQTDYYKVFESFGYTIAHDASSLSNLTDSNAPLLGIFALGTMNVWMDRVLLKDNLIGKQQHPSGNGNDALEQPSLPEMTLAALEVLNKRSEDGFFLMVEAASVDKMNHQLDTNRALADLLEMDHTLGAVTKWLKTNHLDKDTLVMFTCDHGHGFEVYGTVDTEYFNKQNYEQENNIDMRDAIGTYDHGGWPSKPFYILMLT